jgi:hypothetical protein
MLKAGRLLGFTTIGQDVGVGRVDVRVEINGNVEWSSVMFIDVGKEVNEAKVFPEPYAFTTQKAAKMPSVISPRVTKTTLY